MGNSTLCSSIIKRHKGLIIKPNDYPNILYDLNSCMSIDALDRKLRGIRVKPYYLAVCDVSSYIGYHVIEKIYSRFIEASTSPFSVIFIFIG